MCVLSEYCICKQCKDIEKLLEQWIVHRNKLCTAGVPQLADIYRHVFAMVDTVTCGLSAPAGMCLDCESCAVEPPAVSTVFDLPMEVRVGCFAGFCFAVSGGCLCVGVQGIPCIVARICTAGGWFAPAGLSSTRYYAARGQAH